MESSFISSRYTAPTEAPADVSKAGNVIAEHIARTAGLPADKARRLSASILGDLIDKGIIPPRPRVDADEALAVLLEVVKAKGTGYVYPGELRDPFGSCQYTVNDEPACIVGHVVERLGLPVTSGLRVALVGNRSASVLPGFTMKAASVLRAAQLAQDERKTWGEAYAAGAIAANR